MGTVVHRVLIITWDTAAAAGILIRQHLGSLGMEWCEFNSPLNGYQTIFVPPSGSKQGWPTADTHNNDIAAAIEFLDNLNSKAAHGCAVEWVCVDYSWDSDNSPEIADSFIRLRRSQEGPK
jgi:hypothetical protein